MNYTCEFEYFLGNKVSKSFSGTFCCCSIKILEITGFSKFSAAGFHFDQICTMKTHTHPHTHISLPAYLPVWVIGRGGDVEA